MDENAQMRFRHGQPLAVLKSRCSVIGSPIVVRANAVACGSKSRRSLLWPTCSHFGSLHLLKQLFLCLALGGVVAAETELDSLRWKRRVIVIASPSRNTQAYLSQRKELSVESPDWKERDLVLVEVIGPEKADLRGALNLKAGDFTVLLIGKDGGVKLRSGTPVSSREIFELIDSMPMRRQEIRSKT